MLQPDAMFAKVASRAGSSLAGFGWVSCSVEAAAAEAVAVAVAAPTAVSVVAVALVAAGSEVGCGRG